MLANTFYTFAVSMCWFAVGLAAMALALGFLVIIGFALKTIWEMMRA